MPLRISYLVTFVTVVELGSFAKAAKKSEITEGGVSHRIGALEQYFGTKLFTRAIKGSKITEEGKIAFKTAKDILDRLESTRKQIINLKETLGGTIKIEASTIPGEHILPPLINAFKEKHQGVDFIVRISDTKTTFDRLKSRDVDLAAVGTLLLAPRGLEYEEMPIGKEKLLLIVSPGHELARKESVLAKEFLSLPFIGREKGSGTRAETERFLEEAGIDLSNLNITLELGSTESVITAVSEGNCVSIISETAARKVEKAKLIKMLEINGVNNKRKLYLIRNLRRELSKSARLFWEYCKARARWTKDAGHEVTEVNEPLPA